MPVIERDPDEVESLRHALQWALTYIGAGDEPDPIVDAEIHENYAGAQRLAWPDEPENWS